jgi:hypothetical protein
MNKFQTVIFPGLLWAALASLPAVAAPESDTTMACQLPRLTLLEQRLVAKSTQGVEALRQFVFNTRKIYQLDVIEVADWTTARRAAIRECMAAQAAAETPAHEGG